MKNTITQSPYYEYLKDKHVILVGPAGYLQGTAQGGAIDSYDVVVRLNHALPIVHPVDYGKRTDVLYHAMTKTTIEKELPVQSRLCKNLPWLVSALNNAYYEKHSAYCKQSMAIQEDYYTDIKQAIGSKLPSTGIIALKHLLDSPAKTITVKGFDFYKSTVYKGYPKSCPPDKWHDQQAQCKYMRKLVNNSRVSVDTELANIINITDKKISHIRTFKDLDTTIVSNLHKIPRDIDYIIGIPRSGFLAATLIALYLNKPIISLNDYIGGGSPMTGRYRCNTRSKHGKGLLVDDCVGTGKTFNDLKSALKGNNLIFLAVYTSNLRKQRSVPDIVLDSSVNGSRIWQWNMFHHPARKILWDMDGVICQDPPKGIDHPQQDYKTFITKAEPLIIPTLPVYGIVTGRYECYRNNTETWLRKNGVIFNKLTMKPMALRQGGDTIPVYKGDYYKTSIASLFIESTKRQAPIIAEIAGKPVFSLEDNRLYEN